MAREVARWTPRWVHVSGEPRHGHGNPEPQRLGQFWEAVVSGERLTDEPDGFETRLTIEGGPVLDLCFQRVPSRHPSRRDSTWTSWAGPARPRRSSGCSGWGTTPRHRSARCPLGGARRPGGNPCCVMEDRAAYADTADPSRRCRSTHQSGQGCEFWSWLTGWTDAVGVAPGPCATPRAKVPSSSCALSQPPRGRPRTGYLDIRLETGDDPDHVAAGIAERGGRSTPG